MSQGSSTSPWWAPERHEDRLPFLRARGAVTGALRGWFAAAGFTEVETGLLQVSPGNEVHLHALRANVTAPDGTRRERYLRTSPEFACKKLLAAGERRLVEFARVFRDREGGDLHLTEFTMLEWYRAGAPLAQIIDDSLAVVAAAARATGIAGFAFRGRHADPHAPAERLTVAEAFHRHAGIDLLATIRDGAGDRDALAAAAAPLLSVRADDTWSDLFSKLLVARIEPRLGEGRLTVLSDYPAPEAALARLSAGDARVAERFELYACGVELANGFAELTDADEQARRFSEAMDEKQRRYGERYPVDADFIAAVGRMPPASGVALGLDRLVMLAAGARRIQDVVWTPEGPA
jgi:lysyl-tRNA synthetase class 2